jgi:hypothetical protein
MYNGKFTGHVGTGTVSYVQGEVYRTCWNWNSKLCTGGSLQDMLEMEQ